MTGIGKYIYEVIKVWMKEYPDNEYYLLANDNFFLELQLPANWYIITDVGIFRNSKVWGIIRLPYFIKKLKLDVFWGPNFVLPARVKGIKYFVSIHDLAAWKFPDTIEHSNAVRLHLRTKSACRGADGIIAVSQATAYDIIELFKIRAEDIKVCYCGGSAEYDINDVNQDQIKSTDKENISSCLRFAEEYFLFISTIEPRKNVLSIIGAYEKYKERSDSDIKLVLAGKRGWNCDDIYKAVENSVYKEDIVMPGYITEEDKKYLYQNAKLFLFPSLYEGFGIPVLEAMEYGLPVITSRVSSLPEVGGDAVLYIEDPCDVNALAEQMEKVCNMSAEEVDRLRNKMRMQVKKFSWKNCADGIMGLFQRKS